MSMRPITRPNKRRSLVLDTTTIREFNGGWDVVDNDLNLSPRFAKVLTNMYRLSDGSIGIRYGTRMLGDLSESTEDAGSLPDNPFTTTNSSAVVTVNHPNHGMISGHKVVFSGAVDTNGITAAQLNLQFVVTVLNDDEYQITTAGTASSGGTGGGTDVTYSTHNNGADSDIINVTYFQDRLVMVLQSGNLLEVYPNGDNRIIWNNDIAVKSGATEGWGVTTFASFAVFNGELIVCNGTDKPLIVDFDEDTPCKYLVDLSSNSNTNVPICRYVVTMNNYLVMAGDFANPSRVYVSNQGTSGTWFGDADPNDAVNIEVGKVAQSQSNVIRGLGRFRDQLVVAFDDVIALGKLGIYGGEDNTEHIPDFSDAIENHGTISHRSIVNLGDDMLMCDNVGVPSIARAQFTGALRPERVSQLVDPEIQQAVLNLSVGASEDRVFAVYNQRDGQYLLFVPNANTVGSTTETPCFAYTSDKSQRIAAWALFKGWNFSCGCTTALKRVILCGGRKFYVLGADEDPIHADYVNDPDVNESEGNDISFIWELPWADFDKRLNNKHFRHIYFDAKGSAQFTAMVFIDNIYYDPANAVFLPTLQMQFTGGDSIGYGAGEQPYGGLIRASDERAWAWTTKFRIMKLRVQGATKMPLRIVAVSFVYHKGSNQR